ncbi:MAG: Crp/Fnr family transcriptional regulator [Bacteroidia bacterium]|nr:Crp/Fnr family transcriptional regulator [Bacteroidia bacterium]
MKSQLKDFIQAQLKHPSEEEIAEILSIFEERTYSKGEFFKEVHTIAKEVGFITSGSAKSVIIKDNGEERLGRLLPEGSFLFDLISVRKEEKTPIAITFREPSSVLVAPYPAIKTLLETNLTLNIVVREYIADRTVEMAKWLMMFATGTAKDRYQFILENNPKLLNKLPLRMIASMIGITPTQLSRIRSKKNNAF